MSIPARIKVALVGAGGWGRQHARVFAARPDVELCGIMSRNQARAAVRAAEFNTPAYTDIADMLDHERPDLVSVCLPNQSHFAPTLQVIEAGFALLVEKPLVFTMDEADMLIAAAAQRGLFFAINFNHRYARPVRMARAAIERGDLGEIVFATWRFGGEGRSDHPHANLIETQCHGFDTLEHLCGPMSTVMAEMTDITSGGYRTLALALRFAHGAVGSLLGSYDTSYAYPDTQLLEINGTRGRVLVEDTVRRYSFQPAGVETAQVWQAGYFNDRDREFHRTFDMHIDALLQALRAGQEPPVHARVGRRALAVACAAIDSFTTGARVAINPRDAPERIG